MTYQFYVCYSSRGRDRELSIQNTVCTLNHKRLTILDFGDIRNKIRDESVRYICDITIISVTLLNKVKDNNV